MLGLRYVSQSILDEQGAVSSARVQSYIAAIGFFLFGAIAVVFAILGNQMGTTACVTLAGVAFGKSAADMMAAQKKSATVLSASASASVHLNSIPTPNVPTPNQGVPLPYGLPTPAPPLSPQAAKEKDSAHTKRVLSIMRMSFVPQAPSDTTKDAKDWTLRPSKHIFIKDGKSVESITPNA